MSATSEAARDLIAEMLAEHPGRLAVLSSFGAEAAVLLHLAGQVDAALPVLFLDTGHHFPETLAYRDTLVRTLGLSGLRVIRPVDEELAAEDPEGFLWAGDSAGCCALRKVRPLRRALGAFRVLLDGRKRHHGARRAALPVIREEDGLLRVSPLAAWTAEEVEAYRAAHGLPGHPLAARGYTSIGCLPCTTPNRPGEPPRAGRWRGLGRSECGIHQAFSPAAPERMGADA